MAVQKLAEGIGKASPNGSGSAPRCYLDRALSDQSRPTRLVFIDNRQWASSGMPWSLD